MYANNIFTSEAQRENYIRKNVTRIRNKLKICGLTVNDIRDKELDELMRVRGIGKDTLKILEKMKELLKEGDPA